MAAYFIDYIKTYSNNNNKGRELQQFIGKYVQRLVKDDLSMDALKAEIEQEIGRIVPELNRVSSGSQNVKKWEEILIETGHFRDCFFMECDYIEMMDKTRYMGAWHSVNDIQAQAGEKRWREILNMIESKICNIQIVEIPYKIRAWTVRKI